MKRLFILLAAALVPLATMADGRVNPLPPDMASEEQLTDYTNGIFVGQNDSIYSTAQNLRMKKELSGFTANVLPGKDKPVVVVIDTAFITCGFGIPCPEGLPDKYAVDLPNHVVQRIKWGKARCISVTHKCSNQTLRAGQYFDPVLGETGKTAAVVEPSELFDSPNREPVTEDYLYHATANPWAVVGAGQNYHMNEMIAAIGKANDQVEIIPITIAMQGSAIWAAGYNTSERFVILRNAMTRALLEVRAMRAQGTNIVAVSASIGVEFPYRAPGGGLAKPRPSATQTLGLRYSSAEHFPDVCSGSSAQMGYEYDSYSEFQNVVSELAYVDGIPFFVSAGNNDPYLFDNSGSINGFACHDDVVMVGGTYWDKRRANNTDRMVIWYDSKRDGTYRSADVDIYAPAGWVYDGSATPGTFIQKMKYSGQSYNEKFDFLDDDCDTPGFQDTKGEVLVREHCDSFWRQHITPVGGTSMAAALMSASVAWVVNSEYNFFDIMGNNGLPKPNLLDRGSRGWGAYKLIEQGSPAVIDPVTLVPVEPRKPAVILDGRFNSGLDKVVTKPVECPMGRIWVVESCDEFGKKRRMIEVYPPPDSETVPGSMIVQTGYSGFNDYGSVEWNTLVEGERSFEIYPGSGYFWHRVKRVTPWGHSGWCSLPGGDGGWNNHLVSKPYECGVATGDDNTYGGPRWSFWRWLGSDMLGTRIMN